jgi:hypothetical protein
VRPKMSVAARVPARMCVYPSSRSHFIMLTNIQGTDFGADPNAFCRKFHDAAHNAIKMQTPY